MVECQGCESRGLKSKCERSALKILLGKFGESLGGSQAPPSFWEVPGLPRKFPKLPRKFFGDFPGSSLTVELNSNPGVPRKFPRLSIPEVDPGLPRKFPGLRQRSAPFFWEAWHPILTRKNFLWDLGDAELGFGAEVGQAGVCWVLFCPTFLSVKNFCVFVWLNWLKLTKTDWSWQKLTKIDWKRGKNRLKLTKIDWERGKNRLKLTKID